MNHSLSAFYLFSTAQLFLHAALANLFLVLPVAIDEGKIAPP